jgi:hypothetical protein
VVRFSNPSSILSFLTPVDKLAANPAPQLVLICALLLATLVLVLLVFLLALYESAIVAELSIVSDVVKKRKLLAPVRISVAKPSRVVSTNANKFVTLAIADLVPTPSIKLAFALSMPLFGFCSFFVPLLCRLVVGSCVLIEVMLPSVRYSADRPCGSGTVLDSSKPEVKSYSCNSVCDK